MQYQQRESRYQELPMQCQHQVSYTDHRHSARSQRYEPQIGQQQGPAAPSLKGPTVAYYCSEGQLPSQRPSHYTEAPFPPEHARPTSSRNEHASAIYAQPSFPAQMAVPVAQPPPAAPVPQRGFWGRTRLPSDEELLSRLSEAAASFASPSAPGVDFYQASTSALPICQGCGRSQGCLCAGSEPTAPCMPPGGFR